MLVTSHCNLNSKWAGDDGESVEISPHGDDSRDDSLDEDGNEMHIAQNTPAAGRDKRCGSYACVI